MIAALLCAAGSFAQEKGTCGVDVQWSFDGKTLTLSNVSKKGFQVRMDDYNKTRVAPWKKKGLNIRAVHVGKGISNIGSYAFADQKNLSEVIFEGTDVKTIGWGAFLNCINLKNVSLPNMLQVLETVAFANSGLTAITIPDHCRVEDQAFANCTKLATISISPTARIGQYVFASEIDIDGMTRHSLYTGEIRRLPADITLANCNLHGLSRASVEKCIGSGGTSAKDYDYATSDVDSVAALASYASNDTYALIIGNENYKRAADVPYAIHDARTFALYCKNLFAIPADNIHLREDVTKYMFLDDEMEWLSNIPDRENKKLIVYYAGHGVQDKDRKAYILPTDVNGGDKPQNGIALDDFYARLGDLGFNRTSIFLDACFSGTNRDDEGVIRGTRAVGIAAEEGTLSSGSVVVFSAASGAETAQAFDEQGHGLFTYYLLNALKENNGFISYGDLSEYIETNVKRKAPQLRNQKSQTPTTNASDQVEDQWRKWNF